MKTITFFSEKGGVGKSSFSIMYASWLKYKHGVNVALADFNNRISGYRKEETYIRGKLIDTGAHPELKPFDEATAWPIVAPTMSDIHERGEISRMPFASWFDSEVHDGALQGYDVVLCDFPGSITGGEFIQLNGTKMLGLVVVPTEKDTMTMQSTLRLTRALVKMNVNHCVFLNKAELGLKNFRKTYLDLAKILTDQGMRMLPDIVSRSEKMTTIDKVDIIRSTFGFPDFDAPQYGKGKDLGIENLFIDVTRELALAPDLPGTPAAGLTFAAELHKKDDGRQFRGSAFPQYEI